MIIPGILISILTFPGVIIHELAHQLFCRWCRVPVYEVKYFQLSNPCGYVIHETIADPKKNFLTAIGPFILNTILGIVIVLPVSASVLYLQSFHIIQIILFWLGISILMHAFPSTGDAKSLVVTVLQNKKVSIWTKILVAPAVGLIYIGAFGSMFWLDLGYALAIAYLLPHAFI